MLLVSRYDSVRDENGAGTAISVAPCAAFSEATELERADHLRIGEGFVAPIAPAKTPKEAPRRIDFLLKIKSAARLVAPPPARCEMWGVQCHMKRKLKRNKRRCGSLHFGGKSASLTKLALRCNMFLPRFATTVAQVAELADALDSGSSGRKVVEVRVLSWAPAFSRTYADISDRKDSEYFLPVALLLVVVRKNSIQLPSDGNADTYLLRFRVLRGDERFESF
jgi:hypothetical protein